MDFTGFKDVAGLPPEAWGFVERAIQRGGSLFSVADLKKACEARDMQFWAGFERGRCVGVLITEIRDWSGKRVCEIVACGHELIGHETAGECLATIEAWAKTNGCSSVQVSGRKGWERRLPGYAFAFVTLRKELDT